MSPWLNHRYPNYLGKHYRGGMYLQGVFQMGLAFECKLKKAEGPGLRKQQASPHNVELEDNKGWGSAGGQSSDLGWEFISWLWLGLTGLTFLIPKASRLGWELNPLCILLTINCVICQPSGSHQPTWISLVPFLQRTWMDLLLCTCIHCPVISSTGT